MVRRIFYLFFAGVLVLTFVVSADAQKKGMASIKAQELKVHLDFIGSEIFQGRNTPSRELDITCGYVENLVKLYGLKPILPDGSYYQTIPLIMSKLSETGTQLTVVTDKGNYTFNYPGAFGFTTRPGEGVYGGPVVFVGLGVSADSLGWDDYGDVDLRGKLVVMLESTLPRDHILSQSQNARRFLQNRAAVARGKGASAVLTVMSEERENIFVTNGTLFENPETAQWVIVNETERPVPRTAAPVTAPVPAARDTSRAARPPATPTGPFLQAEIRHETAMAILGISKDELKNLFSTLSNGQQVPRKDLTDRIVSVTVKLQKRNAQTENVVACVGGSDPVLKNEYIIIGCHTDHLGISRSRIMPGADDNGSGTVAMLEIAQALMIEHPKRTVILAWFTGEEKGLKGSHFMANNSPVPIEKVSTMLNMDMISRNNPDSLYLIASNLLSTELDKAINDMNKKYTIGLGFDYRYNNTTDRNRFYFRSDQLPYTLFGVPSVWFFCGTTSDYHTPGDTIDKVDYKKMEKVTRLVYLTAMEVGNMKELLKLDANPQVTTRGKHNIAVMPRR